MRQLVIRATNATLLMVLIAVVGYGCTHPARWQRTNKQTDIKPLPQSPIKDVYVVSFLMDGLGYQVFHNAIDKGYLPNFKKYVLDRGAEVENAITFFPSISPPNHTSAMTGVMPYMHGIVGLQWFDRKDVMFRNYVGPDYKALDDDLHLADEVPIAVKFKHQEGVYTIFERLNGHPTVALEEMNCRGATDAPFFELCLVSDEVLSDKKLCTLNATMKYLTNLYAQPKDKIPRFAYNSILNYDIMAHDVMINHKKSMAVLKCFDDRFGELVEQIKKAGIYDKTYFVLFSDHGFHDLKRKESFKKKCLDVATFLRRKGLKPLYRRNYDYNVYVTKSGVSCAAVYLADYHDGTRRKPVWQTRPGLDKLRNYRVSSHNNVDLIQALLDTDKLAFILTPESDGVVRVFSQKGNARVWRQNDNPQLSYSYEPDDPAHDPLGYLPDEKIKYMVGKNKYFAFQQWLENTAACEYPAVVPMFGSYFESPRAGDILVAAKHNVVLKDSAYDATHGSCEREDLRIPMVFAGPGIHKKTIPSACLFDLVPTWLTIFGAPVPQGLHGRALTEIFEGERK